MKDTLKTLELLEEHIDRLAEQGIYEIERDLLLESLRRMYTSVLSIDTVAEEEKVIDALLGLPKEFFEPSDEEMYGCPPADFKEIIPEEDVAEEPEEEAEPVTEEVIAELEEEVIEETEEEEPATEPESIAEETEVGDEIDHEVLISLYDDEEDEEPAVEEESEEEIASEEPEVAEEEQLIEEEPIVEEEQEEEEPITIEEEESQSVVLGDVLAMEQTTLADNLAEQMGTDIATAVGANLSLRQTIAINDKFILMRDLFGGNNDYYETAIEKLDSFDNLDDAMLYIYDHFHWNPNSEGARLLMELLARKLF